MLLVDTSVWIHHFRRGEKVLAKLLEKAEVMTHPFVIGELACGNLKMRREILSYLHALPRADLVRETEALHFIEQNRLMGAGLGYVDVHLLASARLTGVPLWTLDQALNRVAHRLASAYTAIEH